MIDLETCYTEYFSFFNEVVAFWRSMQERSPVLLRPLFNQSEQLRLCSRAQLDDEFLLKFPDVKEKLLGKINLCIEEEMNSILKVQDEVKTYTDGLKTRLNSIEKANEKFDCNEGREFNPLIPAHGKLLEFAIDMWKCFHVFVPGSSQDGFHCRHCSEPETLAHVLGSCTYGVLLRNNRHHAVRSTIAEALKLKGWQVLEEIHCIAKGGSTRRWLGVKTSIDALDYYNKDSIKSVSEAFSKYNKLEQHVKYVTDMTRYLRTSSSHKGEL